MTTQCSGPLVPGASESLGTQTQPPPPPVQEGSPWITYLPKQMGAYNTGPSRWSP